MKCPISLIKTAKTLTGKVVSPPHANLPALYKPKMPVPVKTTFSSLPKAIKAKSLFGKITGKAFNALYVGTTASSLLKSPKLNAVNIPSIKKL